MIKTPDMYKLKWRCKIIVYAFLLTGFSSCTQQYADLLKTLRVLDNTRLSTGHYVIIPNQGCEGCISTAEDFVKRNYATFPQVKYIFTRVQSLKLLRIKLGNEVMNNSQVLIDSANIIKYPEPGKDIYPMIVTVRDHEITGIAYQSPEDDGLKELLRE